MNARKIRVVLVEPFQSRKTAGGGGRPARERSSSTSASSPAGLPGTQNDYIALMDADVKAIVAGLQPAK